MYFGRSGRSPPPPTRPPPPPLMIVFTVPVLIVARHYR